MKIGSTKTIWGGVDVLVVNILTINMYLLCKN